VQKQRYVSYVALLRARLPRTTQPTLIGGNVTNHPLGAVASTAVTSSVLTDGSSSIRVPPPDTPTSSTDSSMPPCASHQSDRLSYREAVDDYDPPTHHMSLQ